MSRDRTGEESDELRIVREHARLFGDGDVEGALGMVHPRAEFVLPDPIAPEGRIYSGHEGFRAGILRWIGDWGAYSPSVDRYIDVGPGDVLVLLTETGNDRVTGEARMRKSSSLCMLKARRMTRCCVFATWEEGFDAAGLDPARAAEGPSSAGLDPGGENRPDVDLWPGAS